MTCKPWGDPALQARAALLPATQCEDCGDQVVAGFAEVPVCGKCKRLATLRQRLGRQPGYVAMRRAKVAGVKPWRQGGS